MECPTGGSAMRVLVLGATGGTGKEIVHQAIDRKHEVTAMVRSPERLGELRDLVQVREGNLLNTIELAASLRGQDAVLSAIGPRVPIARNEEHLLEEFAIALVAAMKQAEVKRVLVESSAFLFKKAIFPPTYLLGRLLFSSVVKDATAMERHFRQSGLSWTLLRPPRLTDGALSRKYRVRIGKLPVSGFTISRADVADCFLKSLEDDNTIGEIVGLSC